MRLVWVAVLASATFGARTPVRRVNWWFDVAENSTTDAHNLETIAKHRDLFDVVMPYNAKVSLNGNVSLWWADREGVRTWNEPLQALGVRVAPYLFDIDNSTQMHLVYANASAVINDALAVATEFNFQGWFIDYEDEHPADTDPEKCAKLASFLTQLADKLHERNMILSICVASWSKLLSNFTSIAASSVDELQLMSTYARPSDYKTMIEDYFQQVKAGAGDLSKAGVGVGIYYDGRGGYAKDWDEQTARDFLQFVASRGGTTVDVFRLLKDGQHDWPHDSFWWDVLHEFVSGTL